MNILVVNDDGIGSAGLAHLAEKAKELGSVWVVAPENQCSAMSHRITVFGTLEARPAPEFPVEGVKAWAISGTPADCVKVGLQVLLPCRPDIIFSGINRGFNVGIDIIYSGTVGAAMEALVNDIPAIAFSIMEGDDYRIADEYLVPIARDLMARPIGKDQIWNVNFPVCSPEGLKGILEDRRPSGLSYYHTQYTPAVRGDGSMTLKLWSTPQDGAEADSDLAAMLENYISIGTITDGLLLAARGKRN